MPILHWNYQGTEYDLPFEGTPTVAEVLRQNGLYAPSPCGGNGKCGKCAVFLSG